MSVPSFFLAFLMMYLALKTGWFPIGGTYSPDYSTLDPMSQVANGIQHLILPVFVLGTSGTAGLMRLMRSQILEIKNSEFVRTARAKGLSERVVIYKHVLRNALNPFVTMAGYSLGDLLGGAALVEAVMNLRLGLLMLEAVRSLDIYLVMRLGPDGHDSVAGRQPARRHRAGGCRSARRFFLGDGRLR